MEDTLHTIGQIADRAKAVLESYLWDFANTGAGEGATRRRSRLGLDSLAFRPRLLTGVGRPDLGTSLLRWQLRTPVVLAPVGSMARYHPDGALAVAHAAGRVGTLGFMGGLSHPGLEDVADAAVGPMAYQIYVAGDRGWLAELVARVTAAGFAAICLTADSVTGAFSDALRVSRWAPVTADDHPNLLGASNDDVAFHMARFTWDDLAWLRGSTELPLILKGVLTPSDALRAADLGVDAIYVSNHGGLVLDHGPAVTDVLAEIVAALAGRVPIIADGGVERGTDVVKLLALGADVVGVGRLACWGAAIGGADGIARVVSILNEEIAATMANIGAGTVGAIEPGMVAMSRPLPRPLA